MKWYVLIEVTPVNPEREPQIDTYTVDTEDIEAAIRLARKQFVDLNGISPERWRVIEAGRK